MPFTGDNIKAIGLHTIIIDAVCASSTLSSLLCTLNTIKITGNTFFIKIIYEVKIQSTNKGLCYVC